MGRYLASGPYRPRRRFDPIKLIKAIWAGIAAGIQALWGIPL